MQPDQTGQAQGTGAPTPNNSNIPLVEGLDPSYNDIVSHIPEDKRPEAANKLKEWHQNYTKAQEEAAKWQDFSQSGVEPHYAQQAVNVLYALEHQPEVVFQALQKHLGYTPQQAGEAMEQMQQQATEQTGEQNQQIDLTNHPEFKQMKSQLDAAAQILLSQREEAQKTELQQQQDAALEKDLKELEKKYGEFPEHEVVMRMAHWNMSAEEAYNDYTKFAQEQFSRRPAPFVLGGGGQVPRQPVDVKKLTDKDTKSLVTQMLEHSQAEGRQ